MTNLSDTRISTSDPFAKKLLVNYLEHRRTDVKSLRESLAAGDLERIRAKGHNLFGSGSAYGLDPISVIGANIEKAAKKGQCAEIQTLIDELESFVDNVRVS